MRLVTPSLNSIAARLVASALGLSLAILLIAGLVLSTVYRQTTETAFDGRLHVYLQALVADVATSEETDRSEPGALGEPRFDRPLSGWYWQITRLDADAAAGGNLKTSKSLFAGRLPQLSDLGVAPRDGGVRESYVTGPDDKRLRVIERIIDLNDDGRYLIAVAGDAEEIEAEIAQFDFSLLLTFTLLGVALAVSSLIQVRFGLRPLVRMEQQLGRIRRGEAGQIEGPFPSEIAPLAEELNLLIDANHEVVDRARTQVGNLAHALKTPLSVIVNEARSEPTPLGEKVREQSAIMRDQMQYYLDRARAAARAATVGSVTDVEPVVNGLVRTFEKICQDRGIAFDASVEPASRFRGEQQDLQEMIGNLVDNAGKWASGRVVIRVSASPQPLGHDRPALAVRIDDDGPGLPADAREDATRRGRRLDETKPGSGLGLSIVTDLATLYGGRLSLDDSPLGGLRAELLLPRV